MRLALVETSPAARADDLDFAGGQADVQIYTGDHLVLNALGWFWIRLMSWMSYVY